MKNDFSSSLKSLGVASHILSLGAETEVQAFADRLVIRTPSQPDYWWGNCLLLRTSVREPETQLAQFREDFPDAGHATLFWDDPRAEGSMEDARFAKLGFRLNILEVLLRYGPAQPVATPVGVGFRALTDARDWDKATELQIETAVEDGGEPKEVADRISRRMAARKKSADDGSLIWFGAFDENSLVADAGVILAPSFRRFQAVETRAAYRGRGIASALVSHASQIANLSAHSPQLIIADTASDVGRIYRRLGFEVSERLVVATRPPMA